MENNKYISWIQKQAKSILEDNAVGATAGRWVGGFYGLGKAEQHFAHRNKFLNSLARSPSKLKRVGGKGAQILGAATALGAGVHFGGHIGAGAEEGLKQSLGKKPKN